MFILLIFHPAQRGSLSNSASLSESVSLGGKLSQGSSEQHCHWDALPGTAEFLSAHVIPQSLIRPWKFLSVSAPLVGNNYFSFLPLLICYIYLGHNITGKSNLSLLCVNHLLHADHNFNLKLLHSILIRVATKRLPKFRKI